MPELDAQVGKSTRSDRYALMVAGAAAVSDDRNESTSQDTPTPYRPEGDRER